MAKATAFLIAGLVIFFGGNTLGVGMILQAHDDRRILEEGVRTTGVIISVKFSTGGRQKEYKELTVSFLAEDRRAYAKGARERYYEHIDGSKSKVADEMHGEKRVVFYDRSDPSNSVIEGAPQSFTAGYLVITLSVGFGASFIWTGGCGLRRKQA
ncbi:DUF3592 domain-containing protein [Arthrobacter sp. G119Y2]|uniref:DUF3592 domain-containing protein n=1 Tax=Arthrobacter sp. G119Y2 TaxID=3134965 RepID=UPI0031193068